ncbi:type IIL restriction-modification enzyme MmeI [Caulobacter sp. 602-1]|uniref:type IIL restriction-modification enzyme MmeI n=1 Tax=Caulobacter sp. 602-1 TaxID=2492472 RepID=UPI000F62EE58|nr:type IIL restriction-modification enzyme MmeI [Caulobacter sp. 602-1]RRN66477.1 hypothetical protein EIK80_04125 [Caulobacter sp. 602-1]
MTLDDFIARWTSRTGGAERANYQMFFTQFCSVLGLPEPDPAEADRSRNDYVFERAVRSTTLDGASAKRIDLYKKGCFLLRPSSRTPRAATRPRRSSWPWAWAPPPKPASRSSWAVARPTGTSTS